MMFYLAFHVLGQLNDEVIKASSKEEAYKKLEDCPSAWEKLGVREIDCAEYKEILRSYRQ